MENFSFSFRIFLVLWDLVLSVHDTLKCSLVLLGGKRSSFEKRLGWRAAWLSQLLGAPLTIPESLSYLLQQLQPPFFSWVKAFALCFVPCNLPHMLTPQYTSLWKTTYGSSGHARLELTEHSMRMSSVFQASCTVVGSMDSGSSWMLVYFLQRCLVHYKHWNTLNDCVFSNGEGVMAPVREKKLLFKMRRSPRCSKSAWTFFHTKRHSVLGDCSYLKTKYFVRSNLHFIWKDFWKEV